MALLPSPRARLRSSGWGRLCRPKPPWLLAAPACELLPRVLSSEVVSVPLVAGAHSRLRLSLIVRHRFFCATVQPPPPAPRSSDPARELILKTIGFWQLCGNGPTEGYPQRQGRNLLTPPSARFRLPSEVTLRSLLRSLLSSLLRHFRGHFSITFEFDSEITLGSVLRSLLRTLLDHF